jgi:LysM repeat protein
MVAGLVTVLAGCAAGSASPPGPTVAVTSTAYVTVPARSTTTTAAPRDDATGSGGGRDEDPPVTADDASRDRIHEIVAGDYLVRIARRYDVPPDYIPEYNGWDDGLGHALVPGETVRIPPSDWLPEDERAAASTDVTADTSASSSGDGCGTYTIQRGDTKGAVAADHDVTVAELDAANVGTPRYSGFVIGIDINIPC